MEFWPVERILAEYGEQGVRSYRNGDWWTISSPSGDACRSRPSPPWGRSTPSSGSVTGSRLAFRWSPGMSSRCGVGWVGGGSGARTVGPHAVPHTRAGRDG
nr:hypothetical protein [Amycolatopsis marina]